MVQLIHLIGVAIAGFTIYQKINKMINSVKKITSKIEWLSNVAADGVAKPLIQIAGILEGISVGLESMKGVFKNKE